MGEPRPTVAEAWLAQCRNAARLVGDAGMWGTADLIEEMADTLARLPAVTTQLDAAYAAIRWLADGGPETPRILATIRHARGTGE